MKRRHMTYLDRQNRPMCTSATYARDEETREKETINQKPYSGKLGVRQDHPCYSNTTVYYGIHQQSECIPTVVLLT